MKVVVLSLSLLLLCQTAYSFSGKLISQKEYIDLWKNEAVQQMHKYKIPASITMAQAVLESSSGNSTLAREGKNHFGIKCHNWDGKTMRLDDDKPDECFRVYNRVEESYEDHSVFLRNQKRYAQLFQLELTDYVSWAKGLKSAGYATNPKYADLLIQLIEKQNLAVLDNSAQPTMIGNSLIQSTSSERKNHQVYQHENNVKFIRVNQGDTYVRIAKEFNLGLWQLYKYNDFSPKKEVLEAGDIVYIQPKRRWSKKRSIVLVKEMSIREVSQEHAIHLGRMLKKNKTFSQDEKLPKGTKIILR